MEVGVIRMLELWVTLVETRDKSYLKSLKESLYLDIAQDFVINGARNAAIGRRGGQSCDQGGFVRVRMKFDREILDNREHMLNNPVAQAGSFELATIRRNTGQRARARSNQWYLHRPESDKLALCFFLKLMPS